MSVKENLSLTSQAVSEKLRRISKRLSTVSYVGLYNIGSTPERLLLAPKDLRIADPITARDILAGRYFLADTMIECESSNPFLATNTTKSWLRELHNFSWFRHLAAQSDPPTKTQAKNLLQNWVSRFSKPDTTIVWENETTALRLITWFCHSVFIVENATPKFYQFWLKSIAVHTNYLRRSFHQCPEGIPRLFTRIALAYADICLSEYANQTERSRNKLDTELNAQIFEDGGHISRNPAKLVDILALLLPLKQSFIRLGIPPSEVFLSTIDKMMAAMKFYRLGDGSLARFNGVRHTRQDLISTILHYDDSLGIAGENAIQSGFQRMEIGETVILADVGAPPQKAISHNYHSGMLSFEMSCGNQLIFNNCGSDQNSDNKLTKLTRSTAAHNTATIENSSAIKFYSGKAYSSLLKDRIISAIPKVKCTRTDTKDAKQFTASHDAYLKNFDIIHSRTMKLTSAGNRIEGTDQFFNKRLQLAAPKKPVNATIRFHLHPSVSAGKTDNGISIILMCGAGMIWKFTCIDSQIDIEESVFLTSISGPKRTKQIVLSFDIAKTNEVRWLITRQNA